MATCAQLLGLPCQYIISLLLSFARRTCRLLLDSSRPSPVSAPASSLVAASTPCSAAASAAAASSRAAVAAATRASSSSWFSSASCACKLLSVACSDLYVSCLFFQSVLSLVSLQPQTSVWTSGQLEKRATCYILANRWHGMMDQPHGQQVRWLPCLLDRLLHCRSTTINPCPGTPLTSWPACPPPPAAP